MGGYRRKPIQLFSQNRINSINNLLAVLACTLIFCADADAQRARFPDFFSSQGSSIPAPANNLNVFQASSQNPSIITTPPIQLTPPPATLQQPNFAPPGVIQGPITFPQNSFPNAGTPNANFPTADPFQSPSQSFPIFPHGTQPPPVQAFPQNQLQFTQPQFAAPSSYGQSQNPSRWPNVQSAWDQFQNQFLPRVLERPRARYTYLPGNNGNELGINSVEIATTATIPNFWGGRTPLLISPGFIFNYWAGPDSTIYPGFDLPPRAYSAYLSFDYVTDTSKVSGLETDLTIGYYSDFNTSDNALRATGKLLGWYRVNCYTVAKLGVEYFDRVKVKLLPAVGIYSTPIPDLKLDLYFPRTKLAQRIPNINNKEVWAYVGAEYGGGSWAIQRADSSNDQVDINDTRAFLGLEWMGPRRVTGFFELGYVFERELLYRSDPLTDLELQDTLMLSTGFAF